MKEFKKQMQSTKLHEFNNSIIINWKYASNVELSCSFAVNPRTEDNLEFLYLFVDLIYP